jgi:hypothetical protein
MAKRKEEGFKFTTKRAIAMRGSGREIFKTDKERLALRMDLFTLDSLRIT